MSNPYGVPGISVQEFVERRKRDEPFILLDVREAVELLRANLGSGVTAVALSQIAAQREAALPDEIRNDKEAEIIVMCHHGNRSAQVTGWLRQNGWSKATNLDGGIDAYAIEIDATVGRY